MATFFDKLVGYWKILQTQRLSIRLMVLGGITTELAALFFGGFDTVLLGGMTAIAGLLSVNIDVVSTFKEVKIDLTEDEYNDFGKLYEYFIGKGKPEWAEVVRFYTEEVEN